MINWMQKHKKSLIPTIWISTIAFVGAGFVGWGAYDYNKNRAGAIAKVGDIKISNQELNTKYREIYSYLSSTIDGGLTQEKANEMKLDEVAASSLIQEALLLNFAKDLGIKATKEDLAKFIVTAPEFQVDGKFNKQLYNQAIKNLGLTTAEFEKGLEKTIALQKLSQAIAYEPTDKTIEAVLSSELIQDKLSVSVIKQDDNVSVSDDEVMKFWESHKDHYLTKQTYELDTFFVEPKKIDVNNTELMSFFDAHKTTYRNTDDTLKSFDEAKDSVLADYLVEFNKDEAVKTYLNVKKGNIQTNNKMVVSDENFPVSELENAKISEFIKPFAYNGGNLIAKITKINEPKAMEFEEAKSMASDDFIIEKKKELLEKKAKNILENFNGTDIGFIARDSKNSISEIDDSEFATLVNDVFSKNEKQGYSIFADKAVVYKVTEQKFPSDEQISIYKEAAKLGIADKINSEFEKDLIKSLEKRYKIEKFYKGRE